MIRHSDGQNYEAMKFAYLICGISNLTTAMRCFTLPRNRNEEKEGRVSMTEEQHEAKKRKRMKRRGESARNQRKTDVARVQARS